jgi:hypothetical protein
MARRLSEEEQDQMSDEVEHLRLMYLHLKPTLDDSRKEHKVESNSKVEAEEAQKVEAGRHLPNESQGSSTDEAKKDLAHNEEQVGE